MGCLIGMPKKRVVIEHKLKNRRKTIKSKTNKSNSQRNKTKQKRTELENFLKTEKQPHGWLKGKQIKFNPRPFSKPKKNLVNFHLDTAKKIDALLEDLEKETEEQNKEKTNHSTRDLAEIREPIKRKTMPPLETDSFFEEINPGENFFQTNPHGKTEPGFRFVKKFKESPDIIFIKKNIDEHIKDGNFHTRMIGGKDIESQKQTMGFAHIKFRNKDKIPKNKKESKEKKMQLNEDTKTATNGENNGVAKTKKALEETKKEIEEKKKELEQAKKEAKEREEELVKKMIEKEKRKKNEEKLKKLEMKKAKIEAKKREKELKKKARIEEKEKKLEAKMALKEEKIRQKKLKEKKRELEKHKKETSDILKVKTKEDKKKKEEEKPPAFHRFVSGKKETIELNPLLDDDVRKVLIITDNLLEKLPEDIIDDFVKSKDFELYEKIINKYKIK